MSFNGSGTFVVNSAGQPVVTGTTITSTAFNLLTADLATGLSTTLTKDGQSTPTANIPMGSFKLTGLANGTAAADAVRMSQLQSNGANYITVAGTADVITGGVTPALTAYAAGNEFVFVVGSTNTTNVTLNVDGLGAKAITKDGTGALTAGDLTAGDVALVVYDGTRFQLVSASYGVSSWAGGTTGLTPASATTGAVSLAGTLVVANGGTGAATLAANNVLLGNGTSAVQVVAPGSSGNLLTSNGTTWASTTPASGGVTTWAGGSTGLTPAGATSGAVSLAGTLVVANGGTGVSTITTGGLVVGAATSAVTSLNPATAGNSIIDSGTAWTSVAQNWSYRNLFTNGEMKVAQRGASIAAWGGGEYSLDGVRYNQSGTAAVFTATQSTTVPNATFVNSLKIDVTTADGTIAAGQYDTFAFPIEGLRCSRIGFGGAAARTLTLSFWWRLDSTNLSFPVTCSGAVQNSAANRSYPFSFSQTTNATWQYHTVTITGDTTGTWLQTSGVGLLLIFAMTAGSSIVGTASTWAAAAYRGATGTANLASHVDNDLYLTGAQLEVGSVATPFEYRSYGEELALCQRYFERWTSTVANETVGEGGYTTSTTAGNCAFHFADKRAAPTITYDAAASFNTFSPSGGTLDCTNITFDLVGVRSARALTTVAAGQTASESMAFRFDGTTSRWIQFSAEL